MATATSGSWRQARHLLGLRRFPWWGMWLWLLLPAWWALLTVASPVILAVMLSMSYQRAQDVHEVRRWDRARRAAAAGR